MAVEIVNLLGINNVKVGDRYGRRYIIEMVYQVGKKWHTFQWVVFIDNRDYHLGFTHVHTAGFKEAKRRHKSARNICWNYFRDYDNDSRYTHEAA